MYVTKEKYLFPKPCDAVDQAIKETFSEITKESLEVISDNYFLKQSDNYYRRYSCVYIKLN